MTKRIILLLTLVSYQIIALAQNSYTISGTVKDAKETLPGAAVYLGGYKISTVTDVNGKFTLPKLAPGNYDVLVQMIGYTPYSKSVEITDKSIAIDILLKQNTTFLNEVVIKPDPNRAYHLALFKDFFIGKTPNATQSRILNPQVLTFDDNKQTQMLTTNASDFLLIENKALGYNIRYLLSFFEYDYRTKIFYYGGVPHFEEMEGSKSKQKQWQKKREIAYNGSIQHFYKSLYAKTIDKEGFVIHKLSKSINKDRPSDSLINANVKRLTTGKAGLNNVITFNATGNDSLSFWLKERKKPKELAVLNRQKIDLDTLVKQYNSDLKMMDFDDELYIVYKNELESETYNISGLRQNRPMDLANYQISVIQLMERPVRFYRNGGVLNPRSVLHKGFWAYEKVADMVPIDYILPDKK
ncbi:MAG: carboxypeptidase-like regulatory domain-containing protein [Flavobacterium sp.]|nr:MAG: carboxypeptidase-like regulatory domain-containing protein [Flavobacterium sp.]